MLPSSGGSIPKTVLRVFVLPAPLCPTMATISPLPRCRSTSNTTCLRPYPACMSDSTSRSVADSVSCGAKVGLRKSSFPGQLFERPLRRDATQFHEVGVVGEAADNVQVVLDDAHRPVLRPKLFDQPQHHVDPLLVDS